MKRLLPLLFVLVIGLTVASVPVAAQEEPDIDATVSEPSVAPGQTQQVIVTFTNDDDDAPPARVVTAEMESGSTPITVRSGTKFIEPIAYGQPVTGAFTVEVPEDIEPGTYDLEIDLEYEYGPVNNTGWKTVDAEVIVEDRAHFAVESVNGTVPSGGTNELAVSLKNVGTQTAHEATVQTTAQGSGLRVGGQSGMATQFVAEWEPDESRTVTVDATAVSGTNPGAHAIRSVVEYEKPNGIDMTALPATAEVLVTEDRSFDVTALDSTLRVGERGEVVATLRNTGPREMANAVLELGQTGPAVQPEMSQYGVGTIPVGETRTVTLPITIAPTAEPTPQRLSLALSYADADGNLQRTGETTVMAPVADERDRFVLERTDSTLRVGEEGVLELEVTNNGPNVEDLVLSLPGAGQNIHPLETEYAIGALAKNESTTVRYPIEVSSNAEAIPRQLAFQVQYEEDDRDFEMGPYNVRTTIEPQKDRFDITATNATIAAGESGEIAVELTNTGELPVSDVNPKIFADDPLSADDDEGYISALKPGESSTVTFEVAAGAGALTKDYPLSMDVQYEESGDTKLTETVQVPVTVTEQEGGGFLPIVAVLVGIALLAGGVYWYRRR
ncbi:S-layer domain-containing protein [Halodesulfurarchaeum formicicum]|uniref:S-layer domain-containing protein n=1 Tax=Halodesulfurarchaeum formicicum TaxID=1873524 RepID=A0A1D8S4N8_9EURY|nr:NEW3 domain-containing protein [Halodesulfurarchaeum formicicum]AOW80315.1 S-layer domain-containing protein [Halodesulfurarchaeum formicicum]